MLKSLYDKGLEVISKKMLDHIEEGQEAEYVFAGFNYPGM